MILKDNDRITLKDIAYLFNKAHSTVRNNKERYLNKLKELCKYHFEGKKIVIDEVFYATYE